MPEADTPFPVPTAVAVELVLPVFESPPSVEREPDAESAGVDPPRSVLALVAVEIAVEKRPDVVSGLLEITDADAETLWLADTRELTVENDGDTDALGTKDAAALLFDRAPEAEAEAETEVGTPPVSPNDANADAGAEPTADAEAALKLLRVTEGEKPALALALSDSNAAEAGETVELGAASVEVSDSLVVNVDCAALDRVLSLRDPGREPVLELDEARDALVLAPDVVVVFAFTVVEEIEAEAVTAPLVDVLSKLALAFAAEDEDDLSGSLAEDKEVDVGLVVLVSNERVLALALMLPTPRAVLARADSLDWSTTDVEEEEPDRPPAAVDISAFVFDTDAVAVAVDEYAEPGADDLDLFRANQRYTQQLTSRREEGTSDNRRKLTWTRPGTSPPWLTRRPCSCSCVCAQMEWKKADLPCPSRCLISRSKRS